MKRAFKYGLIATLVILIGAGAWGAAWLAGTADGFCWLMGSVSRYTPLKVSARKVEGRLLDRLHLEGVRVVLARVETEVEKIDFSWQPLLLFSGRFVAKELTLTGIRIVDNATEKTPPDLAWPRLSAKAGLLYGKIGRLRVDGLTYRQREKEPVSVTAFSTSVAWENGFLSLPDLTVASPYGSLKGNIMAGFDVPFLRFDLAAAPAEPIAGMDFLALQARLLPGHGQEQMAGGFSAAGSAGKAKVLELAGEAGITRQAFNLKELRLTAPGRSGSVTGRGTVTLTAGAPHLALQIKASGLNLASEFKMPTDISGTLTLTGTPELYRGEFTLANRGKGWRMARLGGAYQGDGAGVKLAPLTGSLLAGALKGNLDIRWQDGIALSGNLQGRNLDPAGLATDWKGAINFDLTGNAARPSKASATGEVRARLLESRLHGQALTGDLEAGFAGGNLRIGRLSLRGSGFDISAAGDLDKRLAFDARVGDMGRLIPGTAGELQATGWARWHDGHPEGSVTGRGVNLAAGGLKAAAVGLTAQLGEGNGSPLRIAATLSKIAYDRFQADSVTVQAAGTILSHTANAALHAAGAEARIDLSGSYDRGTWRGEIVRFSGRDSAGPWNLEAPAPFVITARRITLARLAITGPAPERIVVAGELAREPLSSSFRAAWSGLNLARANPWLPREIRIDGRLTGRVKGAFLSTDRLDLDGQASLTLGKVRWQNGREGIDADLHTADLSWGWQGTRSPPAGEASAGRLVVAGRATASGTVVKDGNRIAVTQCSLNLDGGDRGMHAGLDLRLAGGGGVKGTFSSPSPARLAIPAAGEGTMEWTGIDLALIRPWLPGGTSLEGSLAGRAAGKILPGERLDLTGKMSLTRGRIRWQKENETLDGSLGTAELSWGWQGPLSTDAKAIAAGRLTVAGRVAGMGDLTLDRHRIKLEKVSVSMDGNERGLQAALDLSLAGGGRFQGQFSSPGPVRLSVPDEGETDLAWTGIDADLFRPWMPQALSLEGRFAGRATGSLFPGQRLALKGDVGLSGGKVRWVRTEGEINLNLKSASVSWEWRGETLRGTASLVLAEYGQLRGSFQLPLPARLPIAPDRKGPLLASLTGQVQEKGVLASVFPGFIRESHGDLDADLRIGGTWEVPELGGKVKLSGAGAYLPTAGIHVKDFQLALSLEKSLVRIDSFRAVSGPGSIEGSALIRLKGWQVVGYQGNIDGDKFQTVYLPELQILSSPRLTFNGVPEKLTIRGEVRLPELIIFGPPTRAVLLPSKDVVLEGVPKSPEKAFSLALDVQVSLILGDRVFVKAEGIDAQLGGNMDLMLQSLDKITSKGEIRVVKGRYKAYGADLEIVRGRLFYAGGPIERPTLDILAQRKVGDVRAGITVGGFLQAPVIKLYSEPAMTDVDILAYILFGSPLGTAGSAEQAGRMAQVASTLLSKGQSTALQEHIRNRLGLSTLEIQSSNTATAGLMGYKEIPVTPTGATPASQATSTSQTMLTVGKYLTPQLYFSYGRSLFTGGNLFRLRYDIFKHWQVETQTGSESGVDLYYKIEFN